MTIIYLQSSLIFRSAGPREMRAGVPKVAVIHLAAVNVCRQKNAIQNAEIAINVEIIPSDII